MTRWCMVTSEQVQAIRAALDRLKTTHDDYVADRIPAHDYIDARDYVEGNAPDWLRDLLAEREWLLAVVEAAEALATSLRRSSSEPEGMWLDGDVFDAHHELDAALADYKAKG